MNKRGQYNLSDLMKPIKIKSIKVKPLKVKRVKLPRKRDISRMVSPARIREPLSAKIKNAVKKRAHNKCEYRGCNKRQFLKFHHKNMRNDDNRQSNIMLVCSYHHDVLHHKYKRIVEKNILGKETYSKIVRRDKIKKKKSNPYDIGKYLRI